MGNHSLNPELNEKVACREVKIAEIGFSPKDFFRKQTQFS
jgi:hypothetical protein